MLRARIVPTVTAVLFLCISCTGSSEDSAEPAAVTAVESADVEVESAPAAEGAAAPGSLPPGALVELVPSPAELPAGYAVLDGSAGAADAAAVAELSSDPSAAAALLQRSRFTDAYSAEYGEEQTGAFISVVVLRFGDAAGATDYLASRRSEITPATTNAPMPRVGDESFAYSEQLPEGDVTEIVSMLVRVRDLVWVIETGGQETTDTALANDIAKKMVRRTV